MSRTVFTAIVVAVGLCRLLELRVSKARQRAMRAHGVEPVREPRFALMVSLHTAVLVGSLVEVWVAGASAGPLLTAAATAAFVAANLLRWWVIATMGQHWNVQVMASMPLGVVAHGPFRLVRHPNYVAVFVELLALPLMHGAWVTALLGSALHIGVLRARVRLEESVLMRWPAYVAAMGHKPRFLPLPGTRAPGSAGVWPS